MNKAETCGEAQVILDPFGNNPKSGVNNFLFWITREGIVPSGKPDSWLKFEKACNTSIAKPYPYYSSGNMYACTAWVIDVGNMDYLHCTDLSWNGKHKCK